jgi:hypothetical protein
MEAPRGKARDAWLIAIGDQFEKNPFIVWFCDVEVYDTFKAYSERCTQLSSQGIGYYQKVIRLNEGISAYGT